MECYESSPDEGGVPFQVMAKLAVCRRICSVLDEVKYELCCGLEGFFFNPKPNGLVCLPPGCKLIYSLVSI